MKRTAIFLVGLAVVALAGCSSAPTGGGAAPTGLSAHAGPRMFRLGAGDELGTTMLASDAAARDKVAGNNSYATADRRPLP